MQDYAEPRLFERDLGLPVSLSKHRGMDSEIMDGMHPVFRFGLSSVNLKWTTTIR